MAPDVLSGFLVQWGTVAFSVYTALVFICSVAVKIFVSYIKSMQEKVPNYKPSLWFYRIMALLEAVSLNSPAATSLLKSSPLAVKAKP